MEPRDRRLALVHRFFAGTGSSYDLVVNATTFGIDRRWKRRIADRVPEGAERILDLACGTGLSTLALHDRHPGAHIVGVELREEYLAFAREKVRRAGITNIEFVLSRAEDYRSTRSYDAVVSSYLAKYADLARLVPRVRAMLRPGGAFLMHDFTLPPTSALRRLWRLYFAVTRPLVLIVLPKWREVYQGLPDLIARSRWPEELMERLDSNGFRDIACEHLTLYGSAIVTARC